MTKIYLAGGMRSGWQEDLISEIRSIKENSEYKLNGEIIFINPANHSLLDSKEYSTWDFYFLRQSDIVFAYLEETNPKGIGLAVEVGMAKALNKTIIFIDEKSTNNDNTFKIIREASDFVTNEYRKGVKYLIKFISSNNIQPSIERI